MAVHGLTVIVMCLMIIGNLADETCGQGEYIIIQINHIGSQLRVQWTYHVVKKLTSDVYYSRRHNFSCQ